MLRILALAVLIFALPNLTSLSAQEVKKKDTAVAQQEVADKKKQQAAKKKAAQKKAAKDELKLEDIYPEKRLFGPSARGAAFSNDGRYAAYLYKPNLERRHGNDLYVHDFKTDKTHRITNVAVMSEFQRSARKVKKDRIEKAKKSKEKKTESDKKTAGNKTEVGKTSKETAKQKANNKKQQELEELKMVHSVSEKDADDEKAPRYSGISSFVWHPNKNSMLLMSEGEIYQLANIAKPQLVRLTKTQNSESQVNYLPDGSGYTFNQSDVVHRVRFGSHLIEQINPPMNGGLRLSSYSISPDGKRLVMVGRTNREFFASGGRTIDYVRYRDRFAKAATAPRTVSDDETKPTDVKVFLYDLESFDSEESDLIEIFHTKMDEPRDVISEPNWAPDSSAVTFCFFNQEDAEIQVRLSKFPTAEELKKATKVDAPEEKTEENTSQSGSRRRGSSQAGNSSRSSEVKKIEARTVYRFKHDGGPNTPRMVSPDFAADSKQIVFVSEQSGFRHIHRLDPLYESVTQLTNGKYEVYPVRFSKDHSQLFVTATADSSAREMVYTIDVSTGEMNRLSKKDGTYSNVAVSNDGKRMLANYVTYGQLTELVRQNEKGNVKTLTDSHSDKAKKLTKSKPEFFEYENRHGHTIKGMMFKPDGWKKNKKHPLLIYVYGGPLGTRKSVTDGSYSTAAYFFQNYMAKKHGYVTVVIDPRGQSGYGGLFEKSNYEQVGKPQVEDLVDGVKYLTSEYNIDNKRVGMHGWSFGGFQTQMCLYTEPDVFQVGIAGAGPTEWENYNAWYTTGTVGPSRKGQPDQKKYSLRPLAKNLKGQLLLIHGMEDTNVLFQDTVAIYRELLKAGKETHVELFLDPTGSHGLGGDVKNIGRYRKYEDFLLRTLGKGK